MHVGEMVWKQSNGGSKADAALTVTFTFPDCYGKIIEITRKEWIRMKELFEKKPLLYDGSKGVLLQMVGLEGHEAAEEWNVSHPQAVRDIYRSYIQAGSQVIQTNTFPGNRVTLEKHGLSDRLYELNFQGVRLAVKEAAGTVLVGASVGSTGEFLEPAGDLSFEDAVAAFSEQMQAVTEAGADLVCFETFTDLQEMRAAVLALKDVSDRPFTCSFSFEHQGRTLSGNPAESCAIVCQSLGAVLVGANCSGGPESLLEPIEKMYSVASVPLLVKPNAGLPEMENGKQVYHSEPQNFNNCMGAYLSHGVRLMGGCCGTTPAHIAAMGEQLPLEAVPDLRLNPQKYLCSAQCHLDPALSEGEKISMEPLLHEVETGEWEGLMDELMDGEGDYFVLDFGDYEGDLNFWKILSNLCIGLRQPLAIQTVSPRLLRGFLRYYPGRAGVILPEDAGELQKIAEDYGALVLQESC